MKPSDEFAVIVAGVVSANTFQLLNAAGAVVAELGSTTIGVSPAAALFMRHLDATVVDSSLAWTQSAFAGFQSVQITGPKTIAGTTTPLIRLSSVGASSNALMQTAGPLAVIAQVDSSTGFSLTDQNRNNGVLSNYPGWNNYGAVSDNGTDVYYHRLSSSHSRIGHGDFSGGGGSFVEKAYVGVNGVTAAVIGENEAIMRSNLGTGEYVQATGGNINIGPAAGGPDLRHHRVERLLAPTTDHHGGALLGETDRRGRANAAAGTGDKGDLVLKSCLRHGHAPHRKALPPLTARFWPVTKPLSSLARNSAALAMSSGSAMRPMGTPAMMASVHSWGMPCIIGVLVGPGTSVLTRMPLLASSLAMLRVKPIKAALEAQ